MSENNIDKNVFLNRTGFSEKQYYRWFGNGVTSNSPTAPQVVHICATFGWSPTWIFYGLGPRYLSEFTSDWKSISSKIDSIYEHMVASTSRYDKMFESSPAGK